MNHLKRHIYIMLTIVLLCGSLCLTASAAGTQMYGIGFVNSTSLRLRSKPSTSSSILAVASTNECVVVIGQSGDWYRVNYNLQEGYMHKSYLDVLTRENAELGYGVVTGSGVNLRSGPGTSYRVVSTAAKGAKCYIIGLNDGWYKVIYGSNICYIRSDYLELTEIPYENQASPNAPKFFRRGKSTGIAPSASALSATSDTVAQGSSDASLTGQAIVAEAQKYLGAPYVYGGASPAGFDCSGLVYYVLKNLGYSPNRTPEAQYAQGTYVSKANLLPGDIVFFSGNGSTITHVGIYAGNGQFIHSPNSRSTVSYASLTSGYWSEHYYGARRVI
ncbi:MAG: NlpC/P60 family protein [Candidatus Faecousia sp.]|nr:NlpC/P60 family protein [Candidatus Faecousia sp.]